MLRESSIPNEYYWGDLPGILQYTKEPTELQTLVLPENEDTRGYVFAEHSLENKHRLIPDTAFAKHSYKLLLVMKREEEGEIWLKGALQNTETGKIALLTSTNSLLNLTRRENRGIQSLDPTWYVGHYRMSAPIIFWKELQNRMRN